MSAARDLPTRPSLDSLRKQAKKLARDATAGSSDAIARVRAHLPRHTLPLSNRDAQFVIAREYGFAGWLDLTREANRRLGNELDGAAAQARVAINNEDHERLRTLLAEHPALVTWRDANGQSLLSSTTPYALDCSDPERERTYTRPIAAEMLIDAGVEVEPSTWEYLIHTGSSGMLHLLARKRVLLRTLPVLAALGDEPAVHAHLESREGPDEADIDRSDVVGRALLNACRFRHSRIASMLLDRAIALDPDLGERIERWGSRDAFIDFLMQRHASVWSGGPTEKPGTTPWEAFIIRRVMSALDADDLPAFRRWLDDEAWLLESAFVPVQVAAIERACWSRDREPFIAEMLHRDPALLRMQPPPRSSALVYALDYGNAHLIPLLTRVWPLPDDLPHAAGIGNAAAVARWFDDAGLPTLGSLSRHHPGNDPHFKAADLGWGPPTTQQMLDIALAWSVLNGHFAIAEYLLERGANIDTNWSTHEPASILHEAVIQRNEDAVRFLIDHGVDLTTLDHRYRSTAEGWARHATRDGPMAELLAAAAAARGQGRS